MKVTDTATAYLENTPTARDMILFGSMIPEGATVHSRSNGQLDSGGVLTATWEEDYLL